MVDPGEKPGDDVGLDGVGPMDLNYMGPDEGECNHKPDFLEGVGCEPNFAATDVSESDMIGLTTFRFVGSLERGSFFWEAPHDKDFFNFLDSRLFDRASRNTSGVFLLEDFTVPVHLNVGPFRQEVDDGHANAVQST